MSSKLLDLEEIMNTNDGYIQEKEEISIKDIDQILNEGTGDFRKYSEKLSYSDINKEINIKSKNEFESYNIMDNHGSKKFNDEELNDNIHHKIEYQNKEALIDPIQFIDFKKIEKHDNSFEEAFPIKNYRKINPIIKISVLECDKKRTLENRLFSNANSNFITSICAHGDSILAGNNQGLIKMYSCEKEYEYKSYLLKEIVSSERKSVASMDISIDKEYLIAGYSNGYIALWDLNKSKCKKIIDNAHKSCVLACKFVSNTKKKFTIISSDLDGNIYKLIINDGTFSTSVESQCLYKNDTSIFLINTLKLNESENRLFPEINNGLIIALGCLEYIMVCMFEPHSKILFKFEKPKYVKDNYVPDISFGIGYAPQLENNCEESILDKTINSHSFYQTDVSKPHILLAISWDKYIYLYCLPISKNLIHTFCNVGHYINATPIIRMGFISQSIIFFFDSKKYVKVLNTSLFKAGEILLREDTDMPNFLNTKEYRRADLQEEKEIDQDLTFQSYLLDIKGDGKAKATYLNTIISNNRFIYILAKKGFYHLKLLNWEQCLNKTYSKLEWMDAITLGHDIYYGRTKSLAEIPIEEHSRKTKVGTVLRNLINQYAVIHTGNDNVKDMIMDNKFKESIITCITVCIEFCIEIESIQFLLYELQNIFQIKGFGDLFIENLEPFILCDKFINHKVEENTIMKIKSLYEKKKEYNTLSKILVHLDIKSIDIQSLKELCNDKNMINPLIYISTNGKDEDFFHPVKKIFEIFLNSKEVKNFSKYNNYQNYSDLENTKHYIGHKLLWYLDLCVSGIRYPKNDLIPDVKFKKIIIFIISWIFSENHLDILLDFHSISIFQLFTKILESEKIINILNDDKSINELKDESIKLKMKISDFKPNTLIDLIIQTTKYNKNVSVIQNMHVFIAKTSKLKLVDISKSILIESGKYLLNFQSYRREEKNLNNITSYIEEMSEILKEMIDSREDLDKYDYQSLLGVAEISPFVLVKIHLLKKSKNYKRCLDVFLNNETLINEKTKQLFDWIHKTLKELNLAENESDNFENLREEVLNKLPDLADLSIEKVTELVENWFKDDQQNIVQKLNRVPKLQLKYVENLIEKSREDIENQLFGSSISINDQKHEYYIQLLKMHIQLLCQYSKKDVLPILQKKLQFYPINECLKICLEYKVTDATIYLLQLTGAIIESLKLSLNIVKESFKSIMTNLLSDNYIENSHYTLYNEFEKSYKLSVDICEKNSNKLDGREEDLWFPILDQLYKFTKEIRDNCADSSRKEILEQMNRKISQEIRDLLEKMCSYVSIQLVIDNVTQGYKDAEFKDFKKILLKMLSSFSHQKNILNSAKNLLSNSILYNVIVLKKMNSRGNKYILYRCDSCNKFFDHSSNERIVAFSCGHKYHYKCFGKGKDLEEIDIICSICLKNELENNILNPIKNNIKSLIERDNLLSKGSSIINEDEKKDIKYEVKGSKNDFLYNRLKALDKNYVQKLDMVFKK